MYILAEHTKDGFKPTEISENFEDLCDIEYGDVFEGEIQIWEYPAGNMYSVTPDKEVDDKQYYSLPESGLWSPRLELIGTNKELVDDAYQALTGTSENT